MSEQSVCVVIGKNFGDEGKGLAVDHLCAKGDSLVIKHNGGAQAGHTVEIGEKRFVFHQLSAGSFRHCDTFWADTYFPDLYKLEEEAAQFCSISGFVPRIFADANTPVTLIDDVLINMLLETKRGSARHGSCGMGINEAYLRTKAGFGMTVSDFLSKSTKELTDEILNIRQEYVRKHLKECGIHPDEETVPNLQEYLELLRSSNVVRNAVEEMQKNADRHVSLAGDTEAFLRGRERIVFETGQGLLLDAEYKAYSPHLTMSRTGVYNPAHMALEKGLSLTEVIYVTRSYVTRHGAGPLPYECRREELCIREQDLTNIENPWQGSIRYGRHGNIQEFLAPVQGDLSELGLCQQEPRISLFITHLNETDHKMITSEGDIELEKFLRLPGISDLFQRIYLSDARESQHTKWLEE